jgi:uncharacterized membrane protein YeaQ/YmgE (transglycosylase-associated protein family)
MGIFSWIVMGALAGWVARIMMKKKRSMGLIANIVVGIIGAFIGGFVMELFNKQGITGFNLTSFLIALLGSVILLAVVNLLTKGKVR